jgi:tripartite-type tricarboxylate transporter receptor subunit TctC
MMFVTASSAMTFIKNGRIKLLAVTSSKRLAAFPDTPTMAESGLPRAHQRLVAGRVRSGRHAEGRWSTSCTLFSWKP